MSNILLVLGSGPRIGAAAVSKFSAAGYKVATASRNAKESSNTSDHVHIAVDLADPEAVEPVFNKVQKLWGAPSVVVYNAGAHIPTPDGFLATSLSDFQRALNVNTVSVFAAARSAFALNPDVTFFFTGNVTNTQLLPGFGVSGVGKAASAYVIKVAADGGKGKFYYVDQHLENGEPAYGKVSGEAHAELFLKLAEQKEQGEPLHVFRSGG